MYHPIRHRIFDKWIKPIYGVTKKNWKGVKKVLRYIKGAIRILYKYEESKSEPIGCSNADFAGDKLPENLPVDMSSWMQMEL